MARPLSRADALFAEFTPLADSIAKGFSRRGGFLIELDDARQVAHLALWLACQRIEDPISAPAYLSRCIKGALLHHARDFGRAIRIPAKEQELRGAEHPWRLASLDRQLPSGSSLLDLVAEQEHEATTPEPSQAEALEALLDQLPAREAAVLRLRFFEGLSIRQAAAELSGSHSSIARAEKRALASLRAQLA